MRPKHVVVIGAGIVGGSIAFHLAEHGAEVTLIDAGQPGHGASRVSFAWINGRDKNPRGYHELNRRSQDMWRRFADRLEGDVGLTWGGEMRWSVTADGADELRSRVAELQSWGYPIRTLSPDEAVEMEGHIRFGDITAVSFTDSDGHVDPVRVANACSERVRQHGGEVILDTLVEAISVSDGRAHALQAGDREIEADSIVIAGGAASPKLAGLAGIKIGDAHSFGSTTITTPLPDPLFANIAAMHTPRDLPGSLLNILQLSDGSVMIHGGEHGINGKDGSRDDGDQLLQDATQWLPGIDGSEVAEIRRATRPVPPDGLPVLGYAQKVPNVYIAFTHSGVSLAPLIGEFAAIEILDGARIQALEPYRLERFA